MRPRFRMRSSARPKKKKKRLFRTTLREFLPDNISPVAKPEAAVGEGLDGSVFRADGSFEGGARGPLMCILALLAFLSIIGKEVNGVVRSAAAVLALVRAARSRC